jgi:hypothetical protein
VEPQINEGGDYNMVSFEISLLESANGGAAVQMTAQVVVAMGSAR